MTGFDRVKWLGIAAICLGGLLGCDDGADQQAANDAVAAQRQSIAALKDAARALKSETIAQADRSGVVEEHLKSAAKPVNDALVKTPNYWPLQRQKGLVLISTGDFWRGEMVRQMTAAQVATNQSIAQDGHLDSLKAERDMWRSMIQNYEQAAGGVTDARSQVQSKLDAAKKQLADMEAAQQKLTDEVKDLRTKVAAAEKLADDLKKQADASDQSDEQLTKLGQAWENAKKQAAGLQTQIDGREGQIADKQGMIEVQKVEVAALETHVNALTAEIDKFNTSRQQANTGLANVGKPPQSDDSRPEIAPNARTIDQYQSDLEAHLKLAGSSLTAAMEDANKAVAAYTEARETLTKAIQHLQRLNAQASKTATTPEARAAAQDNQSLLGMQLALADANISLGLLHRHLVEHAAIFDTAQALRAEAGMAPLEVSVDATAHNEAAAAAFAEGDKALDAAKTNPATQQANLPSKWTEYIRLARTRIPTGAAAGSGD